MLARSVAAKSSVAASRSAASASSPSPITTDDISIDDITFSTAALSPYELEVLNKGIRNQNRLWRLGCGITRNNALAFLNRNRNNGGGGCGDCDDDGTPIKKKKKKVPPSTTAGTRSSRRIRNLTTLLEELVIESNKLLEEGSKDVIYFKDSRLWNTENDILEHLSFFGAPNLYVKPTPGDDNRPRRKRMTKALNKYQKLHGLIVTNVTKNDIIGDIMNGKISMYKDISHYTDEVNRLIELANNDPRNFVKSVAQSIILLRLDLRITKPPNVNQTITSFKLKITKNINTNLSSGCIDKYHPDNSTNTIINVTLSFPMIGRSNKRFDPNKRSHGKLHKNYQVSFSIDLHNINTDQLIPINIMNVKVQPASGEKTFRLDRFGREFGNTKKYTKATMEEREKYNTIDLEDFYFCMMVDSTGSGIRLPVYINMKTYIVWALVRDYLNSDITNKAIRHANSITDNGIIGGFFGELLCILVRYSVKLQITEWKVANEDRIEMIYFDNIDKKTHTGIQSFLDRVVRTSSEFMIRLMKHSLHNIRRYLTRNDLRRIGWLLWGQHNASWYKTPGMRKYLENNPLDRNYFLFISILQSYDTKDEDTEKIALILSCMAKNSHAFDKIYAGANFDDVMNEYARLLEPYSTSNERAFLHMSSMYVLSVFYDGEIPMDHPIKLRAFHQAGIKKTSIILNTSPDGKHTKIRVGKDRHVANLIRTILELLEDDEIGDLTPTQLEKCIEYVCRQMPENPAG